MSNFRADTESDLSQTFFDEDEFAFEVLYNGTVFLAVEGDVYSQDSGIPGVELPTRQVYIRQADVAVPRAGDTVVIGSATWHVGRGPVLNGNLWDITLQRAVPEVMSL